jgi:hypothetical protein
MLFDKRWTVYDRYSNAIYLTQERWEHIIDPDNHPEMETCEEARRNHSFRATDTRFTQPPKYRYSKAIDGLAANNTHVVAIVLCRFQQNQQNQPIPNNYIVTAYQKRML